MHATNNPAQVVEAHRRRLRLFLIAALVALVAAGSSLAALSGTPAPACLGSGPINNGKAIIAAGIALDVPEDGIVAALTAAMQETGMRNLANPNVPESMAVAHDGLSADRNSLGVLAQTSSWGSVQELMSPSVAAGKFFTALRQGWQRGHDSVATADELAAGVQRAANPDAYANQVPAARQFYRAHIDEVRAAPCLSGEKGGTEAVS